jgi:hypothetical protein
LTNSISSLEKELKTLLEQLEAYQKQKEHFEKLYVWSQGVVKAVQWLETHLEAYCNSLFSGLQMILYFLLLFFKTLIF